MAANSKIEWTDHTWNPWFGCTEVSPACDNCYARAMMADRLKKVEWGAGADRVKTGKDYWKQPYAWDRAAAAAGQRATVFCLSLGDIWDNEIDPLWRDQALTVMHQTPNLIWLLLSKRIGNAVKMTDPLAGHRMLPPNAALGATIVNQEEWDRDSGKLREAGERLGALFTFISVEPMLGRIWLDDWCPDWVICGGESGPHARDLPERLPYDLMLQVQGSGKAFFMKQMAHKLPIPPDLFIREFPAPIARAA